MSKTPKPSAIQQDEASIWKDFDDMNFDLSSDFDPVFPSPMCEFEAENGDIPDMSELFIQPYIQTLEHELPPPAQPQQSAKKQNRPSRGLPPRSQSTRVFQPFASFDATEKCVACLNEAISRCDVQQAWKKNSRK